MIKAHRNTRIIVCVLTGIFIILSPLICIAENDFVKLRTESAKIKTLQADFIQKKFMKILSKPLVSEGCFFYAAPTSIRWEYFKPLKSIVIANKNFTKRYIYSDGKMVEDETGGVQAMKIVLSEVADWMSGKFDQNPSFKAAVSKKANTFITLTPVGESMAGMIEKIEITLSAKGRVVKSVKIFEGAGSFTQINFDNVKVNATINESVFQDVQ